MLQTCIQDSYRKCVRKLQEFDKKFSNVKGTIFQNESFECTIERNGSTPNLIKFRSFQTFVHSLPKRCFNICYGSELRRKKLSFCLYSLKKDITENEIICSNANSRVKMTSSVNYSSVESDKDIDKPTF